MKIIIAIDPNGAIGYKGQLPWDCKEELALFRKKTLNSTLIMGKRTADSVPELKRRNIITVNPKTLDSLSFSNLPKNSWIAGGKVIYEWFLHNSSICGIEEIHLSLMKKSYVADTFIDWSLFDNWVAEHYESYQEFYHYILTPDRSAGQEKQYLNLLQEVRRQPERATRNSITKSLFCRHLSFDLSCGFPLLTTKKMYWKGIVNEFLFFLNGFTDTKWLEERKCFIWKENTSREFLDSLGMTNRDIGLMGPMYGYQWRHFNAKWDEKTGMPLEKGIDQLREVIEQIKMTPNSRRHVITTFNPAQVQKGVLYPCHSIVIQFYVTKEDHRNKLDMFCYNRSSDLFLGLPFNIASSSLLLVVVSRLCNLEPGTLFLSLGDCHIYNSHYEAIDEQLHKYRIPFKLPELQIANFPDTVDEISNLQYEDFTLKSYKSHDPIKAKIVA